MSGFNIQNKILKNQFGLKLKYYTIFGYTQKPRPIFHLFS